MSGNRWRVKHEWYLFYEKPHRVWEAQNLMDGWWETVGHEMTWQKAQNEADWKSRLITVTLPRVDGVVKIPAANGHPVGYKIYPQGVDDYYSAATLHGAWGEIGIFHHDDLEPIARYLLALAKGQAETHDPR